MNIEERRMDLFEVWWEGQRGEWEPLTIDERDRLWVMCRMAWYESRKSITRELERKEVQ